MAQCPVEIILTPVQRKLIREASGKNVARLGIEPADTGEGWLYSGGKKFWLLKHPDVDAYEAARRAQQPRIDPARARFRLTIGESPIHRWGVFAVERIPARRNIIEYTGELVNPVEAYRRGKDADRVYSFKLDEFWRIDGAIGGSGAEFINHSCDPNLRWRQQGGHVLCQSVRPIAAGEELTLDYHFSSKVPKLPCRCGSPRCRGSINALETQAQSPRNYHRSGMRTNGGKQK